METFKRIVSVFLIVTIMITGVVTVSSVPAHASVSHDPTTKVVTKVSTKATNNSVKMKSKAKVSKVTTVTTTKKTSKVISKTAEKKVTENKTVKKVVKTTLTKKSNIKKIKTTVTTTIKTSTTTYKQETVNSIKKKVPANVMNAFNELGFTININSKLPNAGNFSTSKHCIQLKTANSSHLLHEMGHFLSCLKDNAAKSDEFVYIYKSEKDKYKGSNKEYIISTNDEYFAESYRDYVENPSKLKKERPKTYTYINKTAAVITPEDISRTKQKYSWAW